jgi:ribosomal protein S18 acetylase RimI-like enzyme
MTDGLERRAWGVEALEASGDGPAIAALAAAFRDNPLNVAVVGGDPERRLDSNRAGMRQILPSTRRGGVALAARTPAGLGVLLAQRPGAYPLPPAPLGAQLRTCWAQGLRVALRWRRVFEHLDRIHPREPHWYLATLGVDPAAQGHGAGSALLAALLRRADRDALPTYLETDRAENLPFYERAGFRTEQETAIFGARIWHMQRPVGRD